MKKMLFLGAFAVLGLASCKKDYTCECSLNVMGQTTTATYTYTNVKKKDAQSACDANNSTVTGATVTCNLK
jgi:hypothetical protein